MKRCSCTCWAWVHRRILCQEKATRPGSQPTSGNIIMGKTTYMPVLYLPINCHMSGLTFVVFRTNSCLVKASITLRTAAAQHMYNSYTPSTIHLSLRTMVPFVGELLQVEV